jgi:hypothetical protein
MLRSVGVGMLRLFVAMLRNVTNGIYKT